jgi:hypothetical protein
MYLSLSKNEVGISLCSPYSRTGPDQLSSMLQNYTIRH